MIVLNGGILSPNTTNIQVEAYVNTYNNLSFKAMFMPEYIYKLSAQNCYEIPVTYFKMISMAMI